MNLTWGFSHLLQNLFIQDGWWNRTTIWRQCKWLKAAEIIDAINLDTKNLPPIDPFHDIDPLLFEVKETTFFKTFAAYRRREENWLLAWWRKFRQWFRLEIDDPLHKKWSFPLTIYSANVTKSAVFCGFGHTYWRNP